MWILPSRGRPDNLKRMLNAWEATDSSTEVYLRLDCDDPWLKEYEAVPLPRAWLRSSGPRVMMPGALKEAFSRWPQKAWYGILGDDCVPRTPAWDAKLVKAAGAWNVAYCRDGQNDHKHATHPVIGGELVRAWGRITLEGLTHLYNDTVWFTIGQTLNCLEYLPDELLEHMHWSCGKAPRDQIYERVDEHGNPYHQRDQAVFDAWNQSEAMLEEMTRLHKARQEGLWL